MDFQKVVFIAFALVIVYVAPIAGEGQLTCNETAMIVKFNKTELDASGREYNLMFKGASEYPCKVNSSTTSNIDGSYIWIKADYNECGIEVNENDGKLTYNQTVLVSYGKNPNSVVIFRMELEEYHLKCNKMKSLTASVDMFKVSMGGNIFSKVGESKFEVSLLRYENRPAGQFQVEDTSGTANLGDDLYFNVRLKGDASNLRLYPQDCYAVDKSGSAKYMIFQDGCPSDLTVSISGTTSQSVAWTMKSFRFRGDFDKIYISCDVLVCLDGSSNSRCNLCPDFNNARKRRDFSSLTDGINSAEIPDRESLSVRSGWIVFVDTKELGKKNSPQSETNAFSGTKGTIMIVLMALFVFILAVAVIKKFFLSSTAPTGHHPQGVSMKILECGVDNKADSKSREDKLLTLFSVR